VGNLATQITRTIRHVDPSLLKSVHVPGIWGHQLAAVTPVGDLVNQIVIFDYLTGERIRALKGNTADVGCMAFSPDGALLAVGETGLRSKPIVKGEPVFSPSLKVCEIRNGLLVTMATSLNAVSRVAFSPSGDHLACCTDDALLVWKLR
jgi:WD40 repeat protein